MGYKGNNTKLGTISYNGKVYTRCRWGIVNKHLWEVLNSYGCTPKKSLTLTFPSEKIFQHDTLVFPFIRGYFDGDGGLCVCKRSHKLKASFLGTQNFLQEIQIYLKAKNIISYIRRDKRMDKTYILEIS